MADETNVIQYEDFAKIDLRIATVVEACMHPNADKLLLLKVDLAGEERQIVAGLRGYYEPADLVGKQIVVVANLAPRTMRGYESQGMLLAACSDDDSSVVLLTPRTECASGARVS